MYNFYSLWFHRMFGGSHALKLPPLTLNTPLVDYIPRVHKLLKDKVQSIIQSYVQRKEYTAAFLNVFGQSVLEYDTGDFKKLAFLFEYLGFSFIARCKCLLAAKNLYSLSPLSLPHPPLSPPPLPLSPLSLSL